MFEHNSEKKIAYYCKNCNQTTQIKQGINFGNEQHSPFCEHCGEKLHVKEKITKPLHSTHEVSDNLLYKNIFVDDKRFSKDFKGDLVSAISRIIYIKLKAAALKNNLDFTQINLENNFKNGLADYLLTEITSEQMISYEYLSETPNFQPTDFNHIYTQFQSAVKSDEMYAKGIRQYLFWLIGNIYDISSGNKTKFSPFERILTDEFKNIDENEEKFRNHNPNIIRSEAENPHERNSKSEDFKNKKTFLSKLANEDLIVLFGKTFEDYAKNYVHFKIFINEHSDVSSTHNFLETLKISISLLLPPHMLGQKEYIWNSKTFKMIKREDLSLILGQKFYHIKEILRDARNHPLYLISMEFLASYEKNLRKNLPKLNIPKNIIDLLIFKTINIYISIHNPPSSHRYKSLKFHPNLIENYFEHIDNIEKAYWLGLLWADGWISKVNIINDDKYNLAIGLKQALKNKHIIYDYCKAIGFNIDYISKNVDPRYKSKKVVDLSAIFKNDRFAKHLIKKGFIVGSQKSLGIELPKLKSTPFISERDLYLGFLIGLYDGDGSTGRTCITSGNFNFLIQIKEYFQISNKIGTDTYLKLDGTVGTKYRLELGRDLMAKMLINYKYSFKDKRRAIGPKLYTTYDHIVENIEGQLSREKFKSFVWNLGLTFCFSHSLICKKCMKFNIEQPSEEQWLNLSN